MPTADCRLARARAPSLRFDDLTCQHRSRSPLMRPFSSSSTYLHPFICLIFELIGLHPTEAISAKVRRIMRVRSIATLCLFALAVGVALKYQIAGLGICICCLIVYLWPNPPLAARSWLEGVRRYLLANGMLEVALKITSSRRFSQRREESHDMVPIICGSLGITCLDQR